MVVLGVGLSLILQTMFTYTPMMQLVFQTGAISAADLGAVLLKGLGMLLILETEKALRRWLQS
ncbi:cation transporting ATPase C-terminal domain-containing protein [Roseitalea porphyridii]|uniref:cation transporting ATPase C-terminal domain-containing protein n=1 Tax=Roseitalea porphyridii TaxID=1852022 RepID=UPI0032EDB9AB